MVAHPFFGTQTVIFVSTTAAGGLGTLGEETQVVVQTPVPNCRHRPLSDAETPQYLTDVATQVWKTTAPPVPAAIAANPTGHLIANGITYKIIAGAQPFPDPQDPQGGVFKVTILSYVHVG
jgi:hypothetical protein